MRQREDHPLRVILDRGAVMTWTAGYQEQNHIEGLRILGGMARDFITLLRTMHNLKRTNCFFLGFSIQYFWIAVDPGK